jgi:hypothetical protein
MKSKSLRASRFNFVFFLTLPNSFRTRRKLIDGDITPSGNDWPIFVYAGESFDPDDPWNGLFHSIILVQVRCFLYYPLHWSTL